MIVNLFQQLLDAEHLEDELVGAELLEDVPLPEGGDHRAVEAFPRHVVQTLPIGEVFKLVSRVFLVLDLLLYIFVCLLKAYLESVPAGGKLLPVVDPEHPLLPVQPFSRCQRSVRNQIVRNNLIKM